MDKGVMMAGIDGVSVARMTVGEGCSPMSIIEKELCGSIRIVSNRDGMTLQRGTSEVTIPNDILSAVLAELLELKIGQGARQ